MYRIIAVAVLLTGALFAKNTLPVPAPSPKLQSEPVLKRGAKPKGRWHMAENGHAVFCYGPVVVMNSFSAGAQPKRYATQCRGTLGPVPLRD
jgi:hypothetical protein